jgi:hypothetical protein
MVQLLSILARTALSSQKSHLGNVAAELFSQASCLQPDQLKRGAVGYGTRYVYAQLSIDRQGNIALVRNYARHRTSNINVNVNYPLHDFTRHQNTSNLPVKDSMAVKAAS